ncbi:MAG: hypothetical protein WDN75_14275 [Bacteroidota bacterium]
MSFLGVALILADFIWYWMDHRAAKKREDELQRENNVLKAKIYDYQEAAKNADPSKKL